MLSHDWEMRKSHHDRPSTLAASTFMTVGLVSTTQTHTSTNTYIIRPSFLESTVPLADSVLNNSSHSPPQQTRKFQAACGLVSKTMKENEVISQAVNGETSEEARKEKIYIPLSHQQLDIIPSSKPGISFYFIPLLYPGQVCGGFGAYPGNTVCDMRIPCPPRVNFLQPIHLLPCFYMWEETRKLTDRNPGAMHYEAETLFLISMYNTSLYPHISVPSKRCN